MCQRLRALWPNGEKAPMEGDYSAIDSTSGQGSESEPQSDDGAESAPKRAAHQCRFCPEVATRSSRGHSVDPAKAPTDLSPEELTQLRTKTGGGGDEQSPYMCNGCEGKIRRMRAANAQKTPKKKPATKKAKQGGLHWASCLRTLSRLPRARPMPKTPRTSSRHLRNRRPPPPVSPI